MGVAVGVAAIVLPCREEMFFKKYQKKSHNY
jgi:hypothetical protein